MMQLYKVGYIKMCWYCVQNVSTERIDSETKSVRLAAPRLIVLLGVHCTW